MTEEANDKLMEKLVALCKNRGFIFQGSEIYGGLANAWDYGPLGVELYNNVKQAWWQKFVRESEYNVGLDSAILMNPQVWVVSGHVGGFSDPLIDCRACKTRHRADHLIEKWSESAGGAGGGDGAGSAGGSGGAGNAGGESGAVGGDTVEAGAEGNTGGAVKADGWSNEELLAFIREHNVTCPDCGASNFTDVRQFNMMFKTYQGVTDDSKSEIYLRPETAQGIFVNFKNVQRTTRRKMPFGIAQIGKAFRNEITPGNFIFRTREFEQMELEFFCEPGSDLEWFEYWRTFCKNWLLSLGIKEQNLRLRDHSPQELSFYSKATTDFEYLFPFGWGELWGVADRTDYDLSRHSEGANDELTYFDPIKNIKYMPYCIEPSLGVGRATLVFLCDAYDEEAVGDDDVRTVLHLHPALAPIKIGVLPLSKKLSGQAYEVYKELTRKCACMCEFDDTGSIGKRYRRQDEIGTPYCVTYDFESENDASVTIRERDTMEQERVPISGLPAWFAGKFTF